MCCGLDWQILATGQGGRLDGPQCTGLPAQCDVLGVLLFLVGAHPGLPDQLPAQQDRPMGVSRPPPAFFPCAGSTLFADSCSGDVRQVRVCDLLRGRNDRALHLRDLCAVLHALFPGDGRRLQVPRPRYLQGHDAWHGTCYRSLPGGMCAVADASVLLISSSNR